MGQSKGIDIRTYNIIYELIDDISEAVRGQLTVKTEETVIGWVKSKLTAENADAIQNIESAINGVIAEQKTPTRGQGLPWTPQQ